MTTIYGPYTRKDGRKHIVIVEVGKKTTVSYPKYLMEQHLGRQLLYNETVDHINGDFTDDRIENLRIISREENARTGKNKNKIAKYVILICKYCGKNFERLESQEKYLSKLGKDGPFCSKKCIGKLHH